MFFVRAEKVSLGQRRDPATRADLVDLVDLVDLCYNRKALLKAAASIFSSHIVTFSHLFTISTNYL